MEDGFAEDGEDVFEEYAGRGKVWELAKRLLELYRKTGELGGAGGGGAGESARLMGRRF